MMEQETYTAKDWVAKFAEVEILFCKLMLQRGAVITRATEDQDMLNHWDVAYDGVRVDVKALKALRRGEEPNENFHYVEFKNVQGKAGWVYGQAHQFAFETEEYFVVVDKIKLQNFLAKKCAAKECTPYPSFYKIYQREGRLDLMTLVKTIDLMLLADFVLVK